MRFRRIMAPLVLAGLLLSNSALQAKPYALIVGAGEFADKQIKARPTADTDAQAIYDEVTDKAVVGVDKENVHLYLSVKDEKRGAVLANKENVLKGLKDIASKATKDDLVFIAIIAQGAGAGDRACLFMTDSTFKDRAKNALFAAEVETEFKTFKSEKLCVLLDLNLKGFEPGKETVLEPSIFDFVRAFAGASSDKEEQTLPPGRAIILANGGIAPPVTVNDHGIFATAILDALKGKADKEGYEPDGVVTVDEFITYIEKAVPPLARENGKTNEEKQQLPFLEYARGSHFVLSKNAAEAAKVDARIAKFAEIEKAAKLDKTVAEEGRRLLTRMPKLKALQDLRKDYQSLADGNIKAEDFLAKRTLILEGMKLEKDAANTYAEKVYRGLTVVQTRFIKELNIGDLTAQAIKGMYDKADEPMSSELKDKLTKVKTAKRSELIELLAEARGLLGKREDLDGIADAEISIAAAMAKLDPYSGYIDKESIDRSNGQISGSFTGIGVQIRRDLVKDGLLVVTPIKGSPAYRSGMKSGDIIRTIRRPVDNQGNKLDKVEEISTKGMRVDEAVKLIIGKPGTEVEVIVEREGEKSPIEIKLLRGRVDVETVLGFKRNSDDSWDYYLDPKNKIGYIYLNQFARKSYDDLKKVVDKLVADGVKGLILDVRFNPGGYLDVAENICDLFIDDGLIVTIKNRAGESRETRGKQEPSHLGFPMVCLINGGSASASEILSACLQDHNRAIIMGERSYGKGSVQTIEPFKPTGGEIKLTTASFWRPNGKNLNKLSTSGKEEEDWGVRPDKDYVLKLSRQEREELFDSLRDREIIPRRDQPAKEAKEFKDKQLEMATEYLRSQIKISSAPSPKKGRDSEKN